VHIVARLDSELPAAANAGRGVRDDGTGQPEHPARSAPEDSRFAGGKVLEPAHASAGGEPGAEWAAQADREGQRAHPAQARRRPIRVVTLERAGREVERDLCSPALVERRRGRDG